MIIADDLSGACETAAVFGSLPVLLPGFDGVVPADYVTNLGTRELPAGVHRTQLQKALAACVAGGTLFVKIDSLLRGHLKMTLTEIVELGRPVLFSPALPELDRHVREGTLFVGGMRLDQTGLWEREPRPAPACLADLLTDLPHVITTVDRLDEVLRPGIVAIVDLESAEQAAVAARIAAQHDAVLAGASALASGLATTIPPFEPALDDLGPARKIVVAVGSASAAAVRQLEVLTEALGASAVLITEEGPADGLDPSTGLAVLAFSHGGELFPDAGSLLLTRMSEAVEKLAAHQDVDIVVIGGETAGAVLPRLGISRLDVLREVHPGAVVSVAGRRLVATRPGSFGDDTSLLQIVQAIREIRNPTREEPSDE
ncbi:four-carbon acid sugar kinase family protein [Propionimicrobium sp. PCR01-08-3]|uniref:four-carbon acid sugar kinase family protein n=1 Tax=Propionimicrobium sp. PCR01-08-3 TaxID=3052086 RepID=UPI00255D08E7|nr:four-carbon acid sugar kinase family protein [Propionimicrobium sp. PCR01-08-3]WIY81734.1 four-carbon acid sugar kinase family protein [Propionimicrobium sp. PCR01-08-3]